MTGCDFWVTRSYRCGLKAFAAVGGHVRCMDHALMLRAELRGFADQMLDKGVNVGSDADLLAHFGYKELR